jgi:predicted nucleic acid-binding Zn ribbon protein
VSRLFASDNERGNVEMANRRTTEERIAATRKLIEEQGKQLQELLQKQKATERKERTRRLIERGAILESMIDGMNAANNEQVKAFLEKTVKTDFARRMWKEAVPPAPESAEIAQPQGGESVPPKTPTPPLNGGTSTGQTTGNSTTPRAG